MFTKIQRKRIITHDSKNHYFALGTSIERFDWETLLQKEIFWY